MATSVLLMAWDAHGATTSPFKILHSFAGSPNDGAMPTYGTSLAVGGSTLYGSTQMGGVSSNGVLFKMNMNGSGYTVLHNFDGYFLGLNPNGSKNDGAQPMGTPLLVGSTLYGMTFAGGSNSVGTVYRVNTDGSGFQVLHHFGALGDGSVPEGSLIISGETLYGMTGSGGTNGSNGTVFRIDTNGANYRIIHHFIANGTDGGHPGGSLVMSGSMMYGVTRLAGQFGLGTVFRIDTDGNNYQILHQFIGTTVGGSHPFSSLLLDGTTLFGTTADGGAGGVGTVFKIDVNGTGFQLLHSFAVSEAWTPNGDVILVGGKLYGMTRNGAAPGTLGAGTIFEMGINGSDYRVLHTFSTVTSNGTFPYGSLVHANSTLFGMTSLGGSAFQGCVFSYNLGGGGTTPGGTAELAGSFSKIKETCKTKRGVLGCAFMATLTIQNGGTAASTPTHLRYFFSDDDAFDAGSDTQFGEKIWSKIKASKSKKLIVKAKNTASMTGRFILAVDDAGKVVAATAIP